MRFPTKSDLFARIKSSIILTSFKEISSTFSLLYSPVSSSIKRLEKFSQLLFNNSYSD